MILITGGAGYIGSHVNKLLNKYGYKTVVFDNLTNGHRELVKWGRFYDGDLLDKESIRNVFLKEKIDAVMHFAAFAYVGESVKDPIKYYLNNVIGTMNLLEVMLEHNVTTFIFSSTCAIYGNPNEVPIKETHPKNPINPYGKSKLTVESMLEDFSRAYGLNYISLRYFNAAGADPEGDIGEWHDPEPHLIPNVLDAALGLKKYVEIYGVDYDTPDGTCIRDFIHVCDLAEAHILALESLLQNPKSDVFNLGTGQGFSVKEVISHVEKVTGKSVPIKVAQRREGDPSILIADPSKAERELGWKMKYDLTDIIETAWNWHLKLRNELDGSKGI